MYCELWSTWTNNKQQPSTTEHRRTLNESGDVRIEIPCCIFCRFTSYLPIFYCRHSSLSSSAWVLHGIINYFYNTRRPRRRRLRNSRRRKSRSYERVCVRAYMLQANKLRQLRCLVIIIHGYILLLILLSTISIILV